MWGEKIIQYDLLYFLAVLGLHCGAWALGYSTQASHLYSMGFSVVAHGLSCPMACEILVPQLGTEPRSFVLADS